MQHRTVGQGLANGGIQHRRMRRADRIGSGRLAVPVALNHITQKLTGLGGYEIQEGEMKLISYRIIIYMRHDRDAAS